MYKYHIVPFDLKLFDCKPFLKVNEFHLSIYFSWETCHLRYKTVITQYVYIVIISISESVLLTSSKDTKDCQIVTCALLPPFFF